MADFNEINTDLGWMSFYVDDGKYTIREYSSNFPGHLGFGGLYDAAHALCGLSLMEFLPWAERARYAELVGTVRHDGPPISVEHLAVRQDGRRISIRDTVSCQLDSEGREYYLTCYELRAEKEKRRHSERVGFLLSLLRDVYDEIFEIDLQNDFLENHLDSSRMMIQNGVRMVCSDVMKKLTEDAMEAKEREDLLRVYKGLTDGSLALDSPEAHITVSLYNMEARDMLPYELRFVSLSNARFLVLGKLVEDKTILERLRSDNQELREKLREFSANNLFAPRVSDPAAENIPETGVYIRCFGYFDVFIDGEAISFRHEKAKELLALLVDRRGGYISSAEAVGYLWENDPADTTTLARFRKVAMRLKTILEENGIADIVEVSNGKRRLNTEKVRCDLYDYLSGDRHFASTFRGYYMNNYSWSEMTLGQLLEKHD